MPTTKYQLNIHVQPFFRLLEFGVLKRTRERLCMNRVRSMLSTRGMLLGYSFEPRSNNRVPATAGSIINKRMLALEKTSLTRENKIG